MRRIAKRFMLSVLCSFVQRNKTAAAGEIPDSPHAPHRVCSFMVLYYKYDFLQESQRNYF